MDLFSSYGLTQKATNLLENVLKRAPRHTPTLERLLDLYLGASDEQRTVELASQLEQIHSERGDTINAERFKELRQRFQKAAELSEDLPIKPPPAMPISGSRARISEASGSHAPTEGRQRSPMRSPLRDQRNSKFRSFRWRQTPTIPRYTAKPDGTDNLSSPPRK